MELRKQSKISELEVKKGKYKGSEPTFVFASKESNT